MMKRWTLAAVAEAASVLVLFGLIRERLDVVIVQDSTVVGLRALLATLRERIDPVDPAVVWETKVGADDVHVKRLESLWSGIRDRNTSFLLADGDAFVFERYGKGRGPNQRQGVSAMGKSLTVALLLTAAIRHRPR